jgi:hypothetical protein
LNKATLVKVAAAVVVDAAAISSCFVVLEPAYTEKKTKFQMVKKGS